MNVQVLSPTRLSDAQLESWRRLCGAAKLDGGHLRPEFALDAAAVRDDVRVAVIDDPQAGQAFLAFQQRGLTGRPVGGRLSDYQAVVAPPEFSADPAKLVAACGLRRLHFDHLVDPGGAFADWTDFTDGSPYLDLAEGFEAYRAANLAGGSRELKETMRKRRKLQREFGPLELRLFDDSEQAFQALLQWKGRQYDESRITNVFRRPWTVSLLRRLWGRTSAEFRGMLSSLYAGETLVAVHFGLLSDGVLHYWFPAYLPGEAAARCSPGRVLLMDLAQAADTLPLRKIDLGRGMSRYKVSAMSGCTTVAVGQVDLDPATRTIRATWRRTHDWLRRSRLRHPLRWPARAAYRLREWIEFR